MFRIIDLKWKQDLNELSRSLVLRTYFYVVSEQVGATRGCIFNPIKTGLINQLSCLLIFLISLPGELRRIRSDFVQRVSIPVIKGLLDDLWQQKLLSTEDKDFVMEKEKIKTDMARRLIDMVIGKGEMASKEMIDSMKKRDNPLCITLGLISSPTASGPEV